jgi:hypothetical protein
MYDALAQFEQRTGLRVLVDLCTADHIDDAGQGALHAINTLSIDEGFGLRIAADNAVITATLDALGLPLVPCRPRGGAQP